MRCDEAYGPAQEGSAPRAGAGEAVRSLEEVLERLARIECDRRATDLRVIVVERVGRGIGSYEVEREYEILSADKLGGRVVVRLSR
jgi:hypothetical protein